MRDRQTRWLAVVLVLVAAACAGGTSRGRRGGERLLQGLPAGYEIVAANTEGRTRVAEMVPEGESAQDWSQRITTRIFEGGVPEETPEKYYESEYAAFRERCPRSTSTLLRSGEENGYAFAFWMHACSDDPAAGRSEPALTYVKAIRGVESFYVVERAFRELPDEGAAQESAGFLRDIEVCELRSREHPCPGGIR